MKIRHKMRSMDSEHIMKDNGVDIYIVLLIYIDNLFDPLHPSPNDVQHSYGASSANGTCN